MCQTLFYLLLLLYQLYKVQFPSDLCGCESVVFLLCFMVDMHNVTLLSDLEMFTSEDVDAVVFYA